MTAGPSESISLRPATAQDEGFLRFVYAESRREELDQAVWPEGLREQFLNSQFDAQASHYFEHYPDADFLVIEHESRAAGRFYVHRAPSEIRIIDIAIVPEFRGRGIGTALLQQLLAEGQSSARIVTLHVEKFNPAQRLYQRLGFRPAADQGVYWLLQWPPPGS